MASSDSLSSIAGGDYAALIPLGAHAAAAPIPIKRPLTLVGSRKDIVRIHLDSSTVSKAHCVIVLNSWGCYIHDLGSRTHTWVNGQQIGDADLADGDVLQIGRFKFKYVAPTRIRKKIEPIDGELSVSTLTDPLPIHTRVVQIGRRPGSDLQFDDSKVSNIHAILFARDDQWVVRDLGSRTGTWLGGQPVRQELVDDGAKLTIGNATLTFRHRHLIEADDEIDLSAPLTLDEALPPTPAEAPDDFASPKDRADERSDLAALERPLADRAEDDAAAKETRPDPLADTHAGEADAIPSADALASLRRGWRAPADEEPSPPPPTTVKARPPAPPPPVISPAAPLDDAAVAKLLARDDLELEPVDLKELATELTREPIALAPDSPAAKSPPPPRPAGPPTPKPAAMPETAIESPEASIAPPTEASNVDAEAEVDLEADYDQLQGRPGLGDGVIGELEPLEIDLAVDDDLAASDASAAAVDDAIFPVDAAAEVAAPSVDARIESAADTAEVAESAEPSAEISDRIEAPIARLDLPIEPLETADLDLQAAEFAADDEVSTSNDEAAAGELRADPGVAEATAVVDPSLDLVSTPPPKQVVDEPPIDEAVMPAPAADLDASAVDLSPVDAPITAAPDADALVLDDLEPLEPGEDADVDLLSEADRTAPLPVDSTVPAPVHPAGDSVAEPPLEVLPPAAVAEPDEWEDEWDLDAPLAPDAKVDFSDGLDDEIDDEALVDLLNESPATETPPALEAPEPVDELADIEFDLDEPAAAAAPVAEIPDPAHREVSAEAALPVEEAADDAADDNLMGDHAAGDSIDLVRLDDDLADDDLAASPAGLIAAPAGPNEPAVTAQPGAFDESSLDLLDESATGLSLQSADEDEPAAAKAVDAYDDPSSDTAMALDLSAFIEAEDAERAEAGSEWQDAPAAPEPVMDAGEDLPPPTGGSLRDLIPHGPPLIGGMFTPEGPMMIGGSPVIDFSAPPPAPDTSKRRRPLKVGFGGKSAASPFAAGQSSTIADAMGSAAMTPNALGNPAVGNPAMGNSVDVFAAPSPSAEELESIATLPKSPAPALPLPLEEELPSANAFVETVEPLAAPADGISSAVKAEEAEMQAVADLFRPRVTLAPGGSQTGAGQAFGSMPVPRPQDDPAAAAKLRRKRYNRIILCLGAMLPLVGGGVYAIYHFVKPYSVIDAMITYDGLDRLGIEDARTFRANQNNALQSEQVRQKAIAALPRDVNDFGFLRDDRSIGQAIDADPAARWPGDPANVMRLQMKSLDKAGDYARLKSLATALVSASDSDKSAFDSAKRQVDNDTDTLARLNRKLADVNSTLQDLQQAGNARPDVSQITRLQEERQRADAALTAVKSSRQELEAALQVLQRPELATTAPAATIDAGKSDEALSALSAKLAEVQKQSDSQKAEATARSAAARKTLDDSIAQFQKDLQGAQQLKQSPELAAYVDAANRIFIQTRELTEDLIRRQENQRTRLAELRSRLMEKIDASTKDRMAKDQELKKLRDELAIDQRMYNSAIADGDIIDAKKLELTMALVRSRIGGREDLARSDPVYSEAIEALQKIIDTTEQSIVDDRKHIDATLTKVQDDFARNAPVVEKLPDEQKALAEAVEKKLAAVNEARKAYDSAADQTQLAQVKIEQDQKAKAAALQLEIAARRQEVADAAQARASHDTEIARQQKRDATQKQLDDVRITEQKDQQVLDAVSADIDAKEKQRRAFVDSDLIRNANIEQKQALEHDIKQANALFNAHSAEQARLIVPSPKIEMLTFDQPDRRPIYAAGVGGGTFVLLMLPVLWTLMLTSRDAHHGQPMPVRSPTPPPAAGFEPIVDEDEPGNGFEDQPALDAAELEIEDRDLDDSAFTGDDDGDHRN